eukprot:TRINITY_DN28711_c0_g1_i1.p1 TRINITY_DN28711_c0_g1~~TRINITY_DN28711_c0_g1_i1.p1  ORF type:complete len:896 (-),score=132.04 TRINITY_DN28711_c0_g1_i1:61-2748(-)
MAFEQCDSADYWDAGGWDGGGGGPPVVNVNTTGGIFNHSVDEDSDMEEVSRKAPAAHLPAQAWANTSPSAPEREAVKAAPKQSGPNSQVFVANASALACANMNPIDNDCAASINGRTGLMTAMRQLPTTTMSPARGVQPPKKPATDASPAKSPPKTPSVGVSPGSSIISFTPPGESRGSPLVCVSKRPSGEKPAMTSREVTGESDRGLDRAFSPLRSKRPSAEKPTMSSREVTGESDRGKAFSNRDSSEYWNAGAWDPDARVYTGATDGQNNHLVAVDQSKASKVKVTETSNVERSDGDVDGNPNAIVDSPRQAIAQKQSQQQQELQSSIDLSAAAPAFERHDSSRYWNATSWDPDNRVYVGAGEGQKHHLNAVEQDEMSTAAPTNAQSCEDCNHQLDSTRTSLDAKFQAGVNPAVDAGKAAPMSASTSLAQSIGCSGCQAMEKRVRMLEARLEAMQANMDEMRTTMSFYGERLGIRGASLFRPMRSSSGSSSPTYLPRRSGSANVLCPKNGDNDAQVRSVLLDKAVGDQLKKTRRGKASQKVDCCAPLKTVWPGGLIASALKLGTEAGPPVDLDTKETLAKIEDHYQVDDKIVGEGGFGFVKCARHITSGRSCAVKVVNKEVAGDKYGRNLRSGLGESLLRMTCAMPHENVARYFDMLADDMNYYVLMEELTGPELLEQMGQMFPITERHLQDVMRQILSSLAHLHDVVGMYHRDVKLSNFRYRDMNAHSPLVLLDFGFGGSVKDVWDGVVCGTKAYLAPEVVGASAKCPHLPAMDMWATGVILYILLLGELPFREDDIPVLGRSSRGAADHLVRTVLSSGDLTSASSEVADLLKNILIVAPEERITAKAALEHPWFSCQCDQEVRADSQHYAEIRSKTSMSFVMPFGPQLRTG